MKFVFLNDTGRVVNVHPATILHGCKCNNEPINPLEERIFNLPTDTYPWVKMWDYGGEIGLQVLVSPIVDK